MKVSECSARIGISSRAYHPLFGLRWLFRRMNIYPNAYYNYLAQRKKAYQQQKQRILQKIRDIYHAYNGVPGYRTMQVCLGREGMVISRPTVHRYMNREPLSLLSRDSGFFYVQPESTRTRGLCFGIDGVYIIAYNRIISLLCP